MRNIPANEIPSKEEYLKILNDMYSNLRGVRRKHSYSGGTVTFKTFYKITPCIKLIVDWVYSKEGYKQDSSDMHILHKNFEELYNSPVLPVLFNPECFMDYVCFVLFFCSGIVEEEIKRITNLNHIVYACSIKDRYITSPYNIIDETPKGKMLIYNYSLNEVRNINDSLKVWVKDGKHE